MGLLTVNWVGVERFALPAYQPRQPRFVVQFACRLQKSFSRCRWQSAQNNTQPRCQHRIGVGLGFALGDGRGGGDRQFIEFLR